MDYTFHWRPVLRTLPELLEAGLVTMEVAVLAMLSSNEDPPPPPQLKTRDIPVVKPINTNTLNPHLFILSPFSFLT